MRISTAQYFETSASKYQSNYSDTVKTQAQISSGDRIQVASDDPIGASQLIQLQQQKALLEQYNGNMTSLKTSLTTEESVLSGINEALQTARVLAIEAGGASMSDEDRKSIANQIGEIEKQVLGLLNTKDAAGEYLFSGSKSATPPYLQNADGTYTYQGDETQLSLQVSDTLSIASNDTGYSLTEQTPNASRTVVSNSPEAPATVNGRVSLSSGLISSNTAYTNEFTAGQPYQVTFTSSTQFKVFSGATDITAEVAGAGTFDPNVAGGSSFKLRGVDFEINVTKKEGELPADFDAAMQGQGFTLASKPDAITVARMGGNSSTAQITNSTVSDPAAYATTFPRGGALITFGAGGAYQVFAQPFKQGDTAIATGTKAAGDTSITQAGVTFNFAAGLTEPAAGDQFAVKVDTHQNKSSLNTLSDLRKALSAPVGGSVANQNKLDEEIASALSNLSLSMNNNDLVRGSIGARMNSIDIQTAENGTISLNNKATQSAIGDTDVADASIQLTLQQTMLQASQLAFVKISQLSLFNKL